MTTLTSPPARVAETVWTLIPRGIGTSGPSKGKMRFTAFVSAANTGAAATDPLSTTWVNWYDHVAAVVDGGRKQFLRVKSDKGLTLNVGIAPDSVCPVVSPTVDSPEALWKPLWHDLIRIFPEHIAYSDPPLPTSMRIMPPSRGPQVVNTSFRVDGGQNAPVAHPNATSAIDAAWLTGQITTCRLNSKSMTQVQAVKTIADTQMFVSPQFSQLEVAAHLTLRKRTSGALAMTAQATAPDQASQQILQTLQSLKERKDEAAVLTNVFGDPHADAVHAINAEIDAWIASVHTPPSNDSGRRSVQALLTMNRDFSRLSKDPRNELKATVLLYIYETRRAGAKDGFVANTSEMFQAVYSDISDDRKAFIEFAVFHKRCEDETIPNLVRWDNSAASVLNYGSFLKVLSDLGNYPPLLRCLGLAFDLVADQVDWSSAKEAWIDFIDPAVADALGARGNQPKTLIYESAYVIDGGDGDSDFRIQGGFLDIGKHELVDYDADGLALRKIQNASSPADSNTAGAAGGRSTSSQTTNSSSSTIEHVLPMKSAGLTLRDDTGPQTLQNRVGKHIQMRNLSADKWIFSATDLVRGYAPEVFWRNKWYRLTAKRDVYKYRPGGAPNADLQIIKRANMQLDRAFCPVQMEAAVHYDHPPEGGPAVLPYDPHVAPSLFRWDGWSLSVPNPFKPANCASASALSNGVKNPIVVESTPAEEADNQLPKLRFGECYQVRVRAVDLAGDPIEAPDVKSEACSTDLPTCTYRRYDPVPPPVMLFDKLFDPEKSPGEQIDSLIARSEDPDYSPIRYICPPTADLFSLIQQGAFDRENGEIRSPFEVKSFDDVVLDETGNFPTKSLPAGAPAEEQFKFPIYQAGPHTAPSGAYLPDRYASHLCFQLFDLATGVAYGPIVKRSFYDRLKQFDEFDPERNDYTWPHAGHIRVQLRPWDTDRVVCQWHSDHIPGVSGRRVPRLEIYVPQGWQMELLMSCAPTLEQAGKMAAASLADDHLQEFCACMAEKGLEIKKHSPQAVEHLLANGLSSQYTPSRPVNLIHAVKKPLGGASFATAAANTPPNSSVVEFSGQIDVEDGRTTGALNVTVTWKEYRDDPTEPTPRTILHSQTLLQLPNLPLTDIGKANPVQHGTLLAHQIAFPPTKLQFPSIRHRNVQLGVAAISRFQHMYVQSSDALSDGTASTETSYMGPVGKPFLLPVPNSSLPLPPSISHVTPLLPRLSDSPVAKDSFRRVGGAMRIHLSRGWYSSGEGEMLGVVVAPDALLQCGSPNTSKWLKNPALSMLYTRWGTDPLWDLDGVKRTNLGSAFKPAPVASDFVPPKNLPQFDLPTLLSNASLVEESSQKATILAYAPVFTPEDGWHCDIMISHVPSYGCFLKLAVVRYQPNSIPGKEISYVSSVPFVQLRPNRAVVLKATGEKHSHLLAVYGTVPGSSAEGTTQFQAVVEVHHEGAWIPDEDTVLYKPGAACTPDVAFEDGTTYSQQLLDSFILVVQKHHHRHRRVLVREYEKRRTYDMATLSDTAAIAYLVDTSEPLVLSRA
jgi:hypothetical protein